MRISTEGSCTVGIDDLLSLVPIVGYTTIVASTKFSQSLIIELFEAVIPAVHNFVSFILKYTGNNQQSV